MIAFPRAVLAVALVAATAVGGCRDRRPTADEAPGPLPPACPPGPPMPDDPAPSPSADGRVVTHAATSLGLTAFTANGRIQPGGQPTEYFFEYGPSAAYGARTSAKALAPRLAAFYRESWDTGLAGFKGGTGPDLVHVPSGGVSGGFVRYAEPTGDDYNHVDGIGLLHIPHWFNPALFAERDAPAAALGGGYPDLRDARVRVALRGNQWTTNGTELLFWAQATVAQGTRFANWALTGAPLTDRLLTGRWETVEYRLHNDTAEWTFAGVNRALDQQQQRSVYTYAPLDDVLSKLDVDIIHVLAYVDVDLYPSGSIDFDDLEIAYRNHSVLVPSNGGKLLSSPQGSTDDPAALTDGWRNGERRAWASRTSPAEPQELVYELARPVLVQRVQLHQHPEWPAKDVEVRASPDGQTWTTLVAGAMPASSPSGANFAFRLDGDLHRSRLADPARFVQVRILSGYRPERWGVGEIEVFGEGAQMGTDDDWYRVSADISGLAAGQTYHYRLVSTSGGRTVFGGGMTFRVPSPGELEIATRAAARITGTTARVGARVNTLGAEGETFFEYGAGVDYGRRTRTKRAGPEVTPRTVVDTLADLAPGTTVHYRAVVRSGETTRCGNDASFVSR